MINRIKSLCKFFISFSRALVSLLCKKSIAIAQRIPFFPGMIAPLDFHHLKFVWLTWPRLIVRSAGPSQDRIGREGGLAKYLITFELTYRYRDNWTFSCRGFLSATLRNVVRIYRSSPHDPYVGKKKKTSSRYIASSPITERSSEINLIGYRRRNIRSSMSLFFFSRWSVACLRFRG